MTSMKLSQLRALLDSVPPGFDGAVVIDVPELPDFLYPYNVHPDADGNLRIYASGSLVEASRNG